MLEKYRDFKLMQRKYLPKRSLHELNGYYRNCWKTGASKVTDGYAAHCANPGRLASFRQGLWKELAESWDAETMGRIPKAALPPGKRTAAAAAAAEHRESKRERSTCYKECRHWPDGSAPSYGSCCECGQQMLVGEAGHVSCGCCMGPMHSECGGGLTGGICEQCRQG